MSPWADEGELLYIDPHRPPRAGDFVLVELKPAHGGEPGMAYVKKLVATTPNKIRLAQFNPPNDRIEFARDRVLHVHRIMRLAELLGV